MNTKNADTTDKRINLARLATQTSVTAPKNGDHQQQSAALITQRAADAANEIAVTARYQIGRLTEAIKRLEAATTTNEATLAASWLRNDEWDRMQRAMMRLETLSALLD